jgi:hypothetical protein
MTEIPEKYIRVTFDIPLRKNELPIKVANWTLDRLIEVVHEGTELIKFEVLTDSEPK